MPWTTPTGPVTVNEVDLVGYRGQTLADPLPQGVRVLGTRHVDDYLVVRFSLEAPWRLTPSEIGSRAAGLLAYGPPGQVMLQPRPRLAG